MKISIQLTNGSVKEIEAKDQKTAEKKARKFLRKSGTNIRAFEKKTIGDQTWWTPTAGVTFAKVEPLTDEESARRLAEAEAVIAAGEAEAAELPEDDVVDELASLELSTGRIITYDPILLPTEDDFDGFTAKELAEYALLRYDYTLSTKKAKHVIIAEIITLATAAM